MVPGNLESSEIIANLSATSTHVDESLESLESRESRESRKFRVILSLLKVMWQAGWEGSSRESGSMSMYG